MDPVTHSLAGAALSRAGLRRLTPLATATLVIAANAPDIDIVASFGGSFASLAQRRGITHGPIALLVLPFVITAFMLAYDRWRRRSGPRARPLPLLGLAALGVVTHPALDWLNTYGIRLLSPFDERWFYGDAVFIIDPWLWLVLACAVIGGTLTRRGWLGWTLLGAAATALMLVVPQVPIGAKAAWVIGVAAIAVAAVRGSSGVADTTVERRARVAVALALVYIVAMKGADIGARRTTLRAAAERGITAHDIMVAPAAANPFAAELVVRTDGGYQLGSFDWLATERVRWAPALIGEGDRTDAVLSTLQLQQVRDFLRWSRFPYVEEGTDARGRYVRWSDARYPGGTRGLSGPLVRIETGQPGPDAR